MSFAQRLRVAADLFAQGHVRDAVHQWTALHLELRRAGRLEEASSVARSLLAGTATLDPRMRLFGIYAMAETAREGQDFEQAERWIRHALELHEGLCDVRGIACDWASLGELAEERGELELAVDRWNHVLALLDLHRSAEAVHDVLLDLARTHAALGDSERAQECARRAEDLAARWAD